MKYRCRDYLLSKWLKSANPRLPARLLLGRRSEDKATAHLKSKGYRILTRNYSCMQGEIDIIAFDKHGIIVFVEVRSKTEPAVVDPVETIDSAKRRCLIKAAGHYITHHKLRECPLSFRFDVIALRYNQDGSIKDIQHLEDAFQTPET